ncbi:MAG: hypothetical protein ABIP79_00055 [Chitinophagaceae bacterium]
MKRIFSLLVAIGFLVAADAQPATRNSRSSVGANVSVNNRPVQNNQFAADRRLREEIVRINIQYDRKIYQLKNDYYMNRGQKLYTVRKLEQQRQFEIRRAQQHFYQNANRYSNQYGSRNNYRY